MHDDKNNFLKSFVHLIFSILRLLSKPDDGNAYCSQEWEFKGRQKTPRPSVVGLTHEIHLPPAHTCIFHLTDQPTYHPRATPRTKIKPYTTAGMQRPVTGNNSLAVCRISIDPKCTALLLFCRCADINRCQMPKTLAAAAAAAAGVQQFF